MRRAFLFLVIAALWSETNLFAATITLTPKDPRKSDPDLVDRDWGRPLRQFGVVGDGSEIYIGSGELSFEGNRKVAEMVWNNTPSRLNTFTLVYAPSQARITMTAAGSTSAGQFYDFQTPVANPNQPFTNQLIQLKSAKDDREIRITNLVLAISGGSTTGLGTIQVTEGHH